MRTQAGTVAATAVLAGAGVASVVLAGVAVTVFCSSGSPGATGTGTVAGNFVATGGPASDRFPMPGTIRFVSRAGAMITLNSDGAGQFSGQLPAGTYAVSGKSSRYESGTGKCASPRAAHVRAGQTVQVAVVCRLR